MSAAWTSSLRRLVPEPLRAGLRAAFGWRWFEGNYPDWAAAQAASGGYDREEIVARVLAATRRVKAGEAAFERDGVCFDEPAPEPGLLAALQAVATASGGNLRVLDFGGALGTTYWRHRAALPPAGGLRWDVVEQARWVEQGREVAAGTPLRFFATVGEAEADGRHDLLLASTVVQYLPEPGAAIDDWIARGFPWLLFNNLPLHRGAPDRIAVQRVPPSIYPASYPVWFFNRERFLERLAGRYDVVSEFAAEAVWPVGWSRYPSTGLLLRRREAR